MVHLARMRKPALRESVLLRLEALLQGREARTVAGKGKLNEVTISRWRNGKAPFNPNLDTLERLAAGFGVTVGELVGEGPTFEERLRSLTLDEKLELMQRLATDLREGHS